MGNRIDVEALRYLGEAMKINAVRSSALLVYLESLSHSLFHHRRSRRCTLGVTG